MAAKKGQEIATIDVAMVTLTTKDGVELGLKTSTQVGVESQIETTEAIKLIVKGTLIAQKRQKSIITGNSITMKDNVFNPQLVQILQGGTIEYNTDGSLFFGGLSPWHKNRHNILPGQDEAVWAP